MPQGFGGGESEGDVLVFLQVGPRVPPHGEIRENQHAAVFRKLIHQVVRGIGAADSRPRDGDGIYPAVPELCGGVRCKALFAVAHAAQQKEQMGNFRSR